MTPDTRDSRNGQTDESERLETWDQIAFHLRTTRATAQRWENDGLPVRRQIHGKLGRVFAYKSELDLWMRSRTISPPQVVPLPSEPLARKREEWRLWTILLLAGVLGFGVILARAILRTNHRERISAPILLQGGVQEHPDLSPDGTQVVLAWDQGNPAERHIFVAPVSGGLPRKLTSTATSDTFPRWSPDGRRIAFGRYDWQGRVHLTIINSTGNEERTVAEAQGDATYLAWMPDGRSILFTDRIPSGAFALFRVDVDSRERTQITWPPPGSLGDLQIAISPDGQRIAFARFQASSAGDLFVVPAEGGAARRVTYDEDKIEGLTWADRSTVVYSSNRGGSGLSLWRVRCEDRPHNEPLRIVGAEPDAVYPSLTSGHNRAHLVYQRRRRDVHIFTATAQSNATPRRLVAGPGVSGLPAVSPTGDRIAFVSERSGHPELHVSSQDGENPRQITNLAGATLGAPAWSPSGGVIAFTAASSGFCGLYRVGADGQGLGRLIFEQHACGGATWSRNGKWLYFRSTRSGAPQIWKISSAGLNLQQLTVDGGFEGFESSDGASFYFIKQGGPVAVTAPLVPVYRIRAAGGAAVELPVKVRMSFWTSVDSGILFLRLWENDVDTSFRLYRFATQRVEHVLKIPARSDRLNRITATRDGGDLYWGQIEGNSSDAMILRDWQ